MKRTITLVLVAIALTASLAEAQRVSFDRLALQLNQGDAVTVTDGDGQELRGRVVDLSSSTLALEADGLRRDLNRGDVSVIQRRERDSLTNGALVGFASGVAFAVMLVLVVGDGSSAADPYAMPWYALYGAAGAGIGAGLDSLHQGSRVVYRAAPSDRRLALSPVVSRERQGVSVSLGF